LQNYFTEYVEVYSRTIGFEDTELQTILVVKISSIIFYSKFSGCRQGAGRLFCLPITVTIVVPGGVLFLVPVDTRLPFFFLQYASGSGINDDRFDGNIFVYMLAMVPCSAQGNTGNIAGTEETGASNVLRWTTAAIATMRQSVRLLLNEKGPGAFEQVGDDTFRDVFDLLPRSSSVELKRRPVNEISTELTK